MRKGIWITAAVAVGALLIPSAVSAATGTFAATTTRAGVTSSSSTSQPGIRSTATSTAGKGVQGIASRTGAYTTYGVVGQTKSSGLNATGVRGSAPATTGVTNGVWGSSASDSGAGVYGTSSPGVGVLGEGFFGLLSFGHAGIAGGHVFEFASGGTDTTDVYGDFAGLCTMPLGATSQSCPFVSVIDASAAPIVVATPRSTPGSFFWVTNDVDGDGNATGFTLHTAAAVPADTTFNWIVVGVLPPPPLATPASSSRAASALSPLR